MDDQNNNQPQAPAGEQYNPYQQQPQQPQQNGQYNPNPYQQQPGQYQQQPQGQYNPYQQQQQQQGQYNPYQQPADPYQQQGYYAPAPVPAQKNGLAISGMVLGIVSLVFFWWWFFGLASAITGLILSIVAKKRGPNKMATAGLICSIIGLALSTIFMIIWIAALTTPYYYW